MHFKKELKSIIILTILLNIVLLNFINIASIAQDNEDNKITATININFQSATSLTIYVDMNVQTINVFDTIYSSNDISDIATTNPEVLGAIKLRLRDLLKDQLKSCFDKADVKASIQIPSYSDGYFKDEFIATLTATFFNVDENYNVNNLLNGILDMGGSIKYNINLNASMGWYNTYNMILSNKMTIDYANTEDVDFSNNKITWILDNSEGKSSKLLSSFSIKYKNPTTALSDKEDITIDFIIDSKDVNLITLKSQFNLKSLDISEYKILPSFISNLNYIPSDGIRLFVENGLLTFSDIYSKTLKSIEELTVYIIENSPFNQTLNAIFSWDSTTTTNCTNPYNISKMDNSPPVIAEIIDNDVDLEICDMPSRAFFGLINSGAVVNISSEDINFGDDLNKIGLDYSISLIFPRNISINEKNSYEWNRTKPISGIFISELTPKPKYSEEVIDLAIEIDLNKMDLNIPSFFTGKTELTATSNINEDYQIFISKIPNELSIPGKINISFINSDDFRLLIEESVFTDENVKNFLNNKKSDFENRILAIMNGLKTKGIVDKNIFEKSLNWDEDISNMDGLIPIDVYTYSHNIYPIQLNLSLWPLDVDISDQTFVFNSISGKTVTYKIIFPKGISAEAKDGNQQSIAVGKTNEGREYIEVTYRGSDEQQTETISCKLTASSLYVVGLFMPCILSLILVIILIIIVFLLKRKLRGRKIPKEEIDSSGYEGEEYYVPPSPSSKK